MNQDPSTPHLVHSKPRKAVALLSGGLDSMLAARVVMDQGIELEAITFFTGFCTDALRHLSGLRDTPKHNRHDAIWVAEQLGIRHHIIDVVDEYKQVVLNPRHGYGSHLNPCLDCKVFMVRRAREWIAANGFDFIVTGEVVGQRPKSQTKRVLPVVATESGADDLLLRPLSAKLLLETLPERAGWVDRAALHAFSGRSRKPQIELARRLGLNQYTQPAGGCCVLTEAAYADKLRDLWAHRGKRDYEFDDIMLLNVGRHLRPRPHFKLIVSRDAAETQYLEGYRRAFVHLRVLSHPGPLTLIDGNATDDEDLILAARIAARFSQGRAAERVTLAVVRPGLPEEPLEVRPCAPEDISPNWYI
ncbi:MAG: tRNA (5-methylaminomethyl-2-thiouridylate)-methyltransferase [Thiotrichales bacterium]